MATRSKTYYLPPLPAGKLRVKLTGLAGDPLHRFHGEFLGEPVLVHLTGGERVQAEVALRQHGEILVDVYQGSIGAVPEPDEMTPEQRGRMLAWKLSQAVSRR